MQENDIKKYKDVLKELSIPGDKIGGLEFDGEDEEHRRLMNIYKVKSVTGKEVYNTFTDEELCEYIRLRAEELGHVPTQKEVYWVYRIYIKQRFGNWPKALKKAVMSTKAGSGGSSYGTVEERQRICKEKLAEIRKKADELHRPPHMTEMKGCAEILRYKYDTWSQVLEAAGIDRNWKKQHMLFIIEDFSLEERRLLEAIKIKVDELGRAPLRSEIDDKVREGLKYKCKTWRNTLYQIGIEPVEKQKSFTETYLDTRKNGEKIHREILCGGIYKIVKPSKEEKEYLSELKNITKKLGRAPIKEELPFDLYEKLMELCGSYKNLLYQVRMEPLGKEEAQKIKKHIKKKNGKLI